MTSCRGTALLRPCYADLGDESSGHRQRWVSCGCTQWQGQWWELAWAPFDRLPWNVAVLQQVGSVRQFSFLGLQGIRYLLSRWTAKQSGSTPRFGRTQSVLCLVSGLYSIVSATEERLCKSLSLVVDTVQFVYLVVLARPHVFRWPVLQAPWECHND